MTCYTIKLPGGASGLICGNFGPHCVDCGGVGDKLCDYPVGKGKTCDRPMCDDHAHNIAPNLDYCKSHYAEWLTFKDGGGVKLELENVVPFKLRPTND